MFFWFLLAKSWGLNRGYEASASTLDVLTSITTQAPPLANNQEFVANNANLGSTTDIDATTGRIQVAYTF